MKNLKKNQMMEFKMQREQLKESIIKLKIRPSKYTKMSRKQLKKSTKM